MPKPEFQRKIKRGYIRDWPTGMPSPHEVAQTARYVGHAKHKAYRATRSVVKANARWDDAQCDRFAPKQLQYLEHALRAAIKIGFVSAFRGSYPSRAWAFVNGVLHEARRDQPELGTYHGFPIDDPRNYPVLRGNSVKRIEDAPHVEIPGH